MEYLLISAYLNFFFSLANCQNGWTIVRQAGSYITYVKDVVRYTATFHGSKEVGKGLESKIRKEMGLYSINYPSFLDGPFEIEYKFDTESLLAYYSGILSLAGMERITGINRKQLWSYLHGHSKPRKAQVQRIEKAIHTLGAELSTVSL